MNPRRPPEHTCAAKTYRGNVFSTEEEAWVAADAVRYRSGDPVIAFPCRVCKKWHIGKTSIRDRSLDEESA